MVQIPPKFNNPKAYIVYASILSLLLISIGISFLTNFWTNVGQKLSELSRRSTQITDVSDYNTILAVLDHQPRISYTSKAQYLLVEVGEIDCKLCKQTHEGEQSNYNKILHNIIKTKRADYVWVDKVSTTPLLKHVALYCAGEQKSDYFFEYKDILYQNTDFFNIDKAHEISQRLKLDKDAFNTCITSNKYEDRIKKLTEFAKTKMNSNIQPEFFMYRIKTVKVIALDGSEKIQSEPELVARFSMLQDYSTAVEPSLLEILTSQ